ncbi:hypothetical protein AKJ52_02695 [candidate division MSBL1 archaeon SCGC-AAA382C18]|uniref:GTP cyclohydrolase MptA n=1 Tax=candidate division MSBL1 archaeon SCGC-AAA382C18 TaxID=1698281 RepID=A0A133VHV7_9EURY|nr:hypothetical protein AKJ52_02695 [candidate division MSBL1 archaeon SCGC-AAA382C18]
MDVSNFKDVQRDEPDIPMEIDKVGVKGVRRKISTITPKGNFFYDVVLDAFVDLPKDMSGTHMSRDVEALAEAIEEANKEKSSSLEEVLNDISNRLMMKHKYATRVELIAKTQHQYEENFTDPPTNEMANVTIAVTKDRNGKDRRSVKVEIPGLSVCPCAQQTYQEAEGVECQAPSHTQRVNLSIDLTTRDKLVRIGWLIDAARKSFSAPISSLLKRDDEYKLLKKAYSSPKFIEDLVRHAVYYCGQTLKDKEYPEDTEINVEAESLESIHPHNAYARRETTIGNLLKKERDFEAD